MTKPLNIDEWKSLIREKYPVVIGGYSGLGYADPDAVTEKLHQVLEALVAEYGDRLLVVSGGTSEGIGLVYEVAKDLNLPTLGIVSEQAKQNEISSYCDKTLFVPDPEGTWQVKSDEGKSYLVESAKNGQMFYFGGGQVAVAEILEARSKKVPVTIFSEFLPDPKKVNVKLANNHSFNPAPTKNI